MMGANTMDWKSGDWVTFDLSIGQIKELRDGGESFSDGSFETSGRLADRFRPLTLRNKRIVEWFDYHYNELRKIDGEAGFSYPDIHRHFAELALNAIDAGPTAEKPFYKQATEFVRAARDYGPSIQGVRLFRPKLARG
jgi:hypothetical protein